VQDLRITGQAMKADQAECQVAGHERYGAAIAPTAVNLAEYPAPRFDISPDDVQEFTRLAQETTVAGLFVPAGDLRQRPADFPRGMRRPRATSKDMLRQSPRAREALRVSGQKVMIEQAVAIEPDIPHRAAGSVVFTIAVRGADPSGCSGQK